MPFTISHTAAVLPFSRGRFPLSALIMGSMAPDFSCLLFYDYYDSHSFKGPFTSCLVTGILFLIIFHHVLKRPLISLLHENHQKLILPFAGTFHFLPATRLLSIAVAIIFGAATHVVWDSFTHVYGWGIQLLPVLQVAIIQVSFATMKWYMILQHGSTLMGGVIIIYMYYKWYKQDNRDHPFFPLFKPSHKSVPGLTILTVLIVSGSLVIYLTATGSTVVQNVKILAGTIIKTLLTLLSLCIFLYCLLLHGEKSKKIDQCSSIKSAHGTNT